MHEGYMQRAIDLAEGAKRKGNLPFGAVIVRGGTIVAEGQNGEIVRRNVTQHAELPAISEACDTLGTTDLSDCVLYTSAEPCNMCASAAFQAGIATVVMGATRNDLSHIFRQREVGIKELANDASYRIEIVPDVLNQQVIDLFNDINT